MISPVVNGLNIAISSELLGVDELQSSSLSPNLAAFKAESLQVRGSASVKSSGHTYPTVVTFDPHPQAFFTGQHRAMLTPRSEKVMQLQRLGVQQLVLLPFDRELADLSPQQFVEEILVKGLQAGQISVGQDFRFGHRRAGTAQDLQTIAARYGVSVTVVALQSCGGERISSSQIRAALEQGNIEVANRLLGRFYTLTGPVTLGQQLGRKLGFPTANVQVPADKFLPKLGVYAVRVWAKAPHEISGLPGVLNLGYRPTVAGQHLSIEVHLLDWSGDLYGQTLTISLEKFLRAEQKFPSLEALKSQIQADCLAAQTILATTSSTLGEADS